MKIPYGYSKDSTAKNPIIIEQQADVIRLIYHLYLTGYSLGKVTTHLENRFIPSPTGKSTWTRAAIDKILSPLVGMDDYWAVQFEKHDRSNIDGDTGKRKAARYCSKSVSRGSHISTQI